MTEPREAPRRPLTLHVSSDEGGEHAVFLLQEGLGFVVLQNVPSLHHDDQICCEDGVNAVLETKVDSVRQQDGRTFDSQD